MPRGDTYTLQTLLPSPTFTLHLADFKQTKPFNLNSKVACICILLYTFQVTFVALIPTTS